MKIIKIVSILVLLCSIRSSTMQEIVREKEAPIALESKNYFDNLRFQPATMVPSGSYYYHYVHARHLPTMRNYTAYWDFEEMKPRAYYEAWDEKAQAASSSTVTDEKTVSLVYETIKKITLNIDGARAPSKMKTLLDELHKTLKDE